MPSLHRSRYLSCFYCGRRTSALFDAHTRRFDCPHCEATNFLDENGQITDPPVATDQEATTPAKFAVLRSRPPPSSPASDVFCKTCLKNQHLLRSILAQYLPDPDDPDYEAREKHYFAFRRHQEELYPQLCDGCEPKVLQRLEQAAYTAKTDALRRTIEKSMATRKSTSPRRLSFVDLLGGGLWVAGLVLQLFWHLSMLERLYRDTDDVIPFPEDEVVAVDGQHDLMVTLLGAMGPFLALLPAPEQSLRWSVFASILGLWWNPRFIQVYRGFTKHITGISKWYMFQFIAIAMRTGLHQLGPSVLTPDPTMLNKQLAFHLFAGALSILISILAPRAIKIDTTPLFGSSKPFTIPKAAKAKGPYVPAPQQRRKSAGNELTMIDLLQEIDSTPSSQSFRPPSPVSPQGSPVLRPLSPASPQDSPLLRHRPRPQQPSSFQPSPASVNLNGLSLNTAPRYSEEMDWAPTNSRYPAFNATAQPRAQSQPLDPFRTRVPPAPPVSLAAAQRTFGQQPTTRLFPGAPPPPRGVGMFGRLPDQHHTQAHHTQAQQPAYEEPRQPVQFREPQFFNPVTESDPRNSLSDMFSTSFTVGNDGDSQGQPTPAKKKSTWSDMGMSFAAALSMGKRERTASPPPLQIEPAPVPARAPAGTGVGGFPVGALGGGRETRSQRARREMQQGAFGRRDGL